MIHDLITDKVSNRLIVVGLIFGLILQVSRYEAWGILYFLIGALIPILLLFFLFLGNVLGSGDIKLFSVISGSLGVTLGVQCIWYSFVAGAILAIFLFIFRKNFFLRLHHFIQYLKQCYMFKSLTRYCDRERGDMSTFHFTVAIFVGFLCLGLLKL